MWKMIWVLMVALPAMATSFNPQPFDKTVGETEGIIRGRVISNYTNWGMGIDGVKRIYTFTEFEVEEVFKGKGLDSRRIIVREIGGEHEGVGLQVAGAAKFVRGEDVIVFLGKANADGSRDLQGMETGKYNIEKKEDGTEFLAGAGVHLDLRPELRKYEHLLPHEDHAGHEENRGHDDTFGSSKWNLDALRKLIKSQGTAPRAQPETNKKIEVTKLIQEVNGDATGRDATSSEAGDDAASTLQKEGSGGDSWGRWFLALSLAGGTLLAVVAIRKKR